MMIDLKRSKTVLGLAAILFLVSCALPQKADRVDPDRVEEGKGLILGRLKVILNGENVSRKCYALFKGEKLAQINLSESGLVFAEASSGANELHSIRCEDWGVIPVTHRCGFKDASFENQGRRKVTYFGELHIHWKVDVGARRWASLGASVIGEKIAGTAGLAAATALEDETASCGGELKVRVVDRKKAAVSELKKIHPDRNFKIHETLIRQPKPNVGASEGA